MGHEDLFCIALCILATSFLIFSAFVRSIPFLSFIVFIFAWNVPLVSLIFEEISSLSHSILFLYFFALITEEGFLPHFMAYLWGLRGSSERFRWAPKSLLPVTAVMKFKDTCSLEGSYDNLDSALKSRDITLPTKVHIVKAMVFSVVMLWNWELDHKVGWAPKIDTFILWCWRLLRIPWTARRLKVCSQERETTLGFVTFGGEDFDPGSETRLYLLKLLCNNVLLKYKGIEEASDIDIRREQIECPPLPAPALAFSKELYIC